MKVNLCCWHCSSCCSKLSLLFLSIGTRACQSLEQWQSMTFARFDPLQNKRVECQDADWQMTSDTHHLCNIFGSL